MEKFDELTVEKAKQILEIDEAFGEISDEYNAERIAQMDSETLCECVADYLNLTENDDVLLRLLIEEMAQRIEY